MSLRWRIFLAAVLLIVLPLVAMSWALRLRVAAQFEREFNHRATLQLESALTSLRAGGQRIHTTLQGIAATLQDDNQLRLTLVGQRDDLLPYQRDAAGRAMRPGGLEVLQLQDEQGVILSSGHFRNEFGRHEPALVTLLRQAVWPASPSPQPEDLALARVRLPAGEVLALVARQPLTMAGRRLELVGGEILTDDRLSSLAGGQTELLFVEPASDPPATAAPVEGPGTDFLVRTLTVPLIQQDQLLAATLVARVSLAPLRRVQRELDLTLAVALAAALAGAFGLAAWLSARLSRPLQDLARQAARVDLDNPAADLASERRDEVGQLARVLGTMLARLRDDARRLAAAEHRATLGEVARQVNHDLRNGLTPVRNVLRHLGEVARDRPAELPAVFDQRRGTLDGSLAYLEELAGRYARLAPSTQRRRCDLGAIAREASLGAPEAVVTVDPAAPAVLADPVSLRRILDNLLRNAREALASERGTINVEIQATRDPDLGPQCVLVVRDDGVGMPPEVLERVGEDFFTTRPDGTGLGLSNVRRLAGDAGGTLHIDSTPGAGTTVTITFPAAENEA